MKTSISISLVSSHIDLYKFDKNRWIQLACSDQKVREIFEEARAENKRAGPHPRRTFCGGPFLGSPPWELRFDYRVLAEEEAFRSTLGTLDSRHSTRSGLGK